MRLTLYILLTLIVLSNLSAQQIFINEVMTKNQTVLFDEYGNTPDWIEITNGGSNAINLIDYSLSDGKNDKEYWQFPSYILEPDSFLVLMASGKDKREIATYWKTIVDRGDIWKYSADGSGISADWKTNEFDDDSWSSGASGFGYGDNDDSTILDDAVVVYIRKKFTLEDKSKFVDAVLHVDYDDGFIAYLNGVEIARSNMGAKGSEVNQYAFTNHEAQIYSGGVPESFRIDSIKSIINTGENLLAIEGHNVSNSSSDLSLIPFFTLGSNDSNKPDDVSELLELPETLLHTNFSLSSAGESLYLFNRDSSIVDSLVIPELSPDISFGRSIESPDTLLYFLNSTPGHPNTSEGYLEKSSHPLISPEGGFYTTSVQVELNTPESLSTVEIYYTLDGSLPTKNSYRYSTPIVINSTTVIRAVALIPGGLPSEISSQTFLINEQTDLPVISLITDPPNLWDYNEGIYVKGPNAELSNPNFGANFWEDWEKEAYFQFFETDKSLAVENNLGIKIFGGWSRAWPMKSLSLFARNKYGAESIEHNIFPELPFDSYSSVILRNSGNDWNITLFRDAFMQVLVEDLNLDHQAYRPAVVFINGEYWGIHNIREKINEDYLARHYNLDPGEIDELQNNAEIIEGSNGHYIDLLDFIQRYSPTLEQNYYEVAKRIDIDNFIDYNTSQIFFDNTDWPGNNIKYWRPQTEEGKWRWILYDTDFGFGIWNTGNYNNNTLSFALEDNGPGWPNPPWSTFLLRNLLKNRDFKNKFINRFADLANTIFTPSNINRVIDSLANNILDEMPRHIGRWGAFSYSSWQNNIDEMKTFGKYRVTALRNYYRNEFNIAGLYNLGIHIDNPAAGNVKINSLLINQQNWQGTFFQDIEITLKAIPKHGYKFVRWSGDMESSDEILTIAPGGNISIQAVFEKDDYINSIVINEINYNSSPNYDTEDWIELYNNSEDMVDLKGWHITDSEPGNLFFINEGTILESGDYLLLTRDSAAFNMNTGGGINLTGNFTFALSNGGDQIKLYDQNNFLIDSVSFDDSEPWPLEADGQGQTLSLINPDFDNALPQNWRASQKNGTPGRRNDVFVDVKDDFTIVTQYSLEQNYPNPFNPVTTIEYSIPAAQSNERQILSTQLVTLKIYDMLGRKVAELVNQKQEQGNYKVEFNAHELSSGLYFYELKTESFRQTKKMVLIK